METRADGSRVVRVPLWAMGTLVTLMSVLLSAAVGVGVTKQKTRAFDGHMGDQEVHVNAPLVEFRLKAIEDDLAEVLTLLRGPGG